MRVQPLVALVIVFATATFAGCDSDLAGGPDTDNVQGVYSLQSINGEALPSTEERESKQEPGATCLMISGRLTVDIDDTAWTAEESECLFMRDGVEVDFVEQSGWFGTWSQAGNQITFVTETGCTQTGTWSGPRITVAEDCTYSARLIYEFLRPLRL